MVGVADEIDITDFEDCLLDFMDMQFNMMIEDNSAKDVSALNLFLLYIKIGIALMKVRA